MDKAVQERRDQPVRPGTVVAPVAGGDDGPALRQFVFTKTTVQGQLQAGRLHQRRGLGQLVEEQQAVAILWEKTGGTPDRPAVRDARQAPQVDRVQQGGPDVNQRQVAGVGGLTHQGTFADARLAPEIDGAFGRDQGREGADQLRRSHDQCSFHE